MAAPSKTGKTRKKSSSRATASKKAVAAGTVYTQRITTLVIIFTALCVIFAGTAMYATK